MFGRNKPLVEVIAREERSLWLQSEVPLQGAVKVEARVGSETVSMTIRIVANGTSYDTLDALIARLGYSPRPFLYLAELKHPLTLWPHLAVLLEVKPEPANKRAHEREPFRLRVLCPSFQGYQGVATNLSELGAEIECAGPVDVGTELELTLEPDRGSTRSLRVLAVVRRCRSAGKTFLVGVELTGVSPSARQQLKEILDSVRGHTPGVIPRQGPVR